MVRMRSDSITFEVSHTGDQAYAMLKHRLTDKGAPTAIWMHGVLGDPADVMFDPLARAAARQGVAVMSIEYGQETWGNSASRSMIANFAIPWLTSKGYDTSKVALMGGSHGSINAMTVAAARPDLIGAVGVMLPITDLEAVRAANRGGYAASIEAAYGGNTAWQANRASYNPIQQADELAATDIPVRLYASTDDPYGLWSENQAFVAAVGAGQAELIGYGAQGHSYNNFTTAMADAFGDWLVAILDSV